MLTTVFLMKFEHGEKRVCQTNTEPQGGHTYLCEERSNENEEDVIDKQKGEQDHTDL